MNRYLSFLFLALVSFTPAWAMLDEEPLEPELVFKLRAYAVNPTTLRAEWDVLDGYYLYREKFKFKTTTAGVTFGTPTYPPGKTKTDEFFGTVTTYRNKVAIDLPLTRAPGSSDTLQLEAVSQGCADAGLCYPPFTQKVSVVLPPLENAASLVAPKAAASPSILDDLRKRVTGGGQSGEFLEADQAFKLLPTVDGGNAVVARFEIADGYYLYRDKIKFTLVSGEGVTLEPPLFPVGKEKEDESFGKMVVYFNAADVKIPLTRTNTGPLDIEIKANYQGCADAGFCYPPITKTFMLQLPEGSARGVPELSPGTAAAAPTALSEQDEIAQTLAGSSWWLIVATFFGFGLLLAFTPCVFPMVPILSSIIVGQGAGLTARKGFVLSLVYVLAMALTYTAAGVIAGLFGQNLQAAFQNPWVLGTFSAIFVALAFSMFGFYDLQLPSSLQTRLTEISNSQKGGTLAGVAVMGFLSALIVGPCVAAPLAGALIYIGQTGDAVLGGIALFALSMGMGAPLLLIGLSAGKLLPRAGAWMDAVKAVFGVMMLAVAIWMLERIIPEVVAMLLWGALLICSAVYMGALTQLDAKSSGWRKLWKGLGWGLLVYGALLLIGVAAGGKDVWQPLRGVFVGANVGAGSGAAGVAEAVHFKRIKSVDDLEREVALAAAAGQPVMLDFFADWCVSCKEMEKYTFSDPGVRAAMAKGVLLQADVTANDDADKALLKRFNLVGPPSLIFYDRTGQEHREWRLVGFLKADRFKEHVTTAFM